MSRREEIDTNTTQYDNYNVAHFLLVRVGIKNYLKIKNQQAKSRAVLGSYLEGALP